MLIMQLNQSQSPNPQQMLRPSWLQMWKLSSAGPPSCRSTWSWWVHMLADLLPRVCSPNNARLCAQLLKELCDRLHWPSADYSFDIVPGSGHASRCRVILQYDRRDLLGTAYAQLPLQILEAMEQGQSSGPCKHNAVARQAAARNMLKALAPACSLPQGSIDLLNKLRHQGPAEAL